MTTSNNKLTTFMIDNKYRVYRHLILQVVILLTTSSIFFDAPDKANFSTDRILGGVGYYLFINLMVYVNPLLLFPRYQKRKKLGEYIISVVLFTVLAMIIALVIQEFTYDIAVTHQQPSAVELIFSLLSSFLSLFLFQGGISAFLLLRNWIVNNQRIGELNVATTQSELMFLKSQINPHFLFNILNNANIMIDEDPETASRMLLKLDELITYQMNDSTKDTVLLDADIRFLNDYLELEKTRRDNFEYIISVNGDAHIRIAPLLFIPFVENAVKHNLDSESPSFVHIKFDISNNSVYFECENSVPEKKVVRKDGGLGLSNIKRRLDLLYGDRYSLKVMENERLYKVELNVHYI